jgi:choline dehydrogenase-like flavoprotein
MDATEYDVMVFGGGAAGKLVAWTMTREGRRNAIVERKYIGGSRPNVACLPSKNVILTHLMEGIGLAVDLKGGRMFITDFGGSVYSANLDGSVIAEGNITGIAYEEVPSGY